jgi:MFS family permease
VAGRAALARTHLSAVWRNHSLRRVLIAFGVFRPAESAQWIAILVFAYRAGGSDAMGAAAVLLLVPAAVCAPFVAHIGDVVPRERALAFGYLAQAVTMAATAVAIAVDAPIGVVFVCAAAANVAITITRPVHLAILPELTASPSELSAANSLSSTVEGASLLVGPAVAAICLEVRGPAAVFGLAAAGLLIAAALAFTLRPRRDIGSFGDRVEGAMEGFRELRRRPGTRVLLGFVAAQTVVIGALDVLTVILALSMLSMGPSGPGVLSAAVGIGGLVGAAATVVLIGRERLSGPLLLGVVGVGIPIACVAASPGVAVALVLLAVSGIGKSFLDVTARTLLQRSVDDDVLARVFGVQEGLNMAALAAGSVAAPVLLSFLTPSATFVIVGLFLPVIALLAFRQIRGVDRTAIVVDPSDVELLRRTTIFEPLGPAAIERAVRKLIRVDVDAGAVLMQEGDRGDRFYVIADGAIEISAGGSFLARLGPGDYLGEIALLQDIPRTATAVAVTPCSLRAMERSAFLAVMTGSASSQIVASQEIARRLSNTGSEP